MTYELLPIALLGGVLGLDVVSFPQAMISRPIVAATLAGGFVGHPINGLIMGIVLELLALDTIPVGASRYPEWGSASVTGGALYATYPGEPAGALPAAALAALAVAWVGGWTMVELRKLNARSAARRRDALEAGSRGAVIGLQLTGMTLDLLRGTVLTAIAMATFHPIVRAVVGAWTVERPLSRALTIGIAAAVALAATYKLFHGIAGTRWYFACGLAVGLALHAL